MNLSIKYKHGSISFIKYLSYFALIKPSRENKAKVVFLLLDFSIELYISDILLLNKYILTNTQYILLKDKRYKFNVSSRNKTIHFITLATFVTIKCF